MGDRLATIDMGRKLRAVPLLGGELGPHVTQCGWAEAYVRTKWHLDHPAVWPQQTWADFFFWGGAVSLGGAAGSASNTNCPVEAYHRTKWHFGQSSRLAATNIGRKLGDVRLFGEKELGLHLAQCDQGRGLPLYQVAS